MEAGRPDLRPRLRRGDLGRALLGLLGASLGLQLASWLLPGFDVGGWIQAVVAAILIMVGGAVLRPLLVHAAVLMGWVGAVLLGLFGQALVVWLILTYSIEAEVTLWTSVLAAWIVAAVSTLFVWVGTAGTDEAVTATLLRRQRRYRRVSVADPEMPGVVFVQADGVPFPLLEWGVRAGTLPTLSRWVRDGTHRMVEWTPKLPATTPVSQMGILHGTIEGIPAFRWIDRATGKIFVANKPSDAALIEAARSNGHGLLADDGVSISNLFTGDAPTAFATMSAVGRSQEGRESRLAVSQFLARPEGFARGLSRTLSEVVRERFQATRARRRDIRPRVHRGWNFALERAGLNGVLRDLNTMLVADSMLRGRRAVYVDYVDYDAVAHHAGIMQPESLAALEGIDAVLAQLEKVAEAAPRPYRIVVLSDHGQSQGAVFADRYGEDLARLVSRLSDTEVLASERNTEGASQLSAFLASTGGSESVLARALSGASQRLAPPEPVEGTVDARTGTAAEPSGEDERFVVFGSGNLGLVYVAGEPRRVTLAELSRRFPALVPGLVAHPGVGFVVVDTDDHGPVALGRTGEHRVREGVVVGEDPLARFGPHAPEFVLRAATMPEAPDLYVNSLLDDLGEVAAFEGLVGCHGGLGGWQDRAMLVWPTDLPEPEGPIVGADALHRVLVGWLEHLGHRSALPSARLPQADEIA